MNYYRTLGVETTAKQDKIRSAFRTLAKRWHPDKPDGDAARFTEIQEAYEVLGDDAKRAAWEKERAAWMQERGYVECPKCGTPNRLKVLGVAMNCGQCLKEGREQRIAKNSPDGLIRMASLRLVQGVAEQAEDFADAAIDAGSLKSHELLENAKDLAVGWLRKRLGPDVSKKRRAP